MTRRGWSYSTGAPGGDEDLGDGAGAGGFDLVEGLHRLDEEEGLAGGDGLAEGDVGRGAGFGGEVGDADHGAFDGAFGGWGFGGGAGGGEGGGGLDDGGVAGGVGGGRGGCADEAEAGLVVFEVELGEAAFGEEAGEAFDGEGVEEVGHRAQRSSRMTARAWRARA